MLCQSYPRDALSAIRAARAIPVMEWRSVAGIDEGSTMSLPPCPHCGSTGDVMVTRRYHLGERRPWNEVAGSDRYECMRCGRIREDVRMSQSGETLVPLAKDGAS